MNNELNSIRNYFNSRCDQSEVGAYAAAVSSSMNVDESEQLYDEFAAEASALLQLGPQDRILDIGCATGDLLLRLRGKVSHAEGLDISETMVKTARKKGVDAHHYDGEKFPYRQDSFDKILIHSVLTNIPTAEIAEHLVMSALQLLKPGGLLLLGGVPDRTACPFPTYAEAKPSPRAKLSLAVRALLHLPIPAAPPVRYYSFEANFFYSLAQRAQCASVSFIRPQQKIMRDGKMHILFRR